MYVALQDTSGSQRADTLDLEVFREWLTGSLQSFPDRTIPQHIDLIVDGYDVVDAREYPEESRLKAGAKDGYDVIMLTGSSRYYPAPDELPRHRPDIRQNTLPTTPPIHSYLA